MVNGKATSGENAGLLTKVEATDVVSRGFMRIEMLPARHGDCLLLTYGDALCNHRILIDGGPAGAYGALRARIDRLPPSERRFELVVLSHVDADHIEGLIKLFANGQPWPFTVNDVWFNGWRHLEPVQGSRGVTQGEFFSALLARRLGDGSWNSAFGGRAVVVRDDEQLPQRTLAGGMTLTLLSPTIAKLDRLRETWRHDLADAIEPGDLDKAWALLAEDKRYRAGRDLPGNLPELQALIEKQWPPDQAVANGSSIAFLAEYAGGDAAQGDGICDAREVKSCLLLADAHPDVICESLTRLLRARGLQRLRVDAVKVAHHGSKANTSDELMSLIDSPCFLFSSNGAQFGHPDEEAVERVIARSVCRPPTLNFNYLSAHNAAWQHQEVQDRLGYRAVFNTDPRSPMVIAL